MAKLGTGPGGADGPASFFPGEAFVNTVQLEIGGQQVDQHSSDWIHMYGELFRTGEASTAYRRLVDFDGYEPTGYIKRFYIPLIFFFNRNPGLALPLIALDFGGPKASRRARSGHARGSDGWAPDTITPEPDARVSTQTRERQIAGTSRPTSGVPKGVRTPVVTTPGPETTCNGFFHGESRPTNIGRSVFYIKGLRHVLDPLKYPAMGGSFTSITRSASRSRSRAPPSWRRPASTPPSPPKLHFGQIIST